MNPATTTIVTGQSNVENEPVISFINPDDLYHLVESLASLNLGYLTLSATLLLAVFSLLGGAFVYFNIRPLRESLNKQEERLREAESKTLERMEAFQDEQRSSFDDISLKVDTKTTKLEERVDVVRKKFSLSLVEFKKEIQNSLNLFKESLVSETFKNIEIEKGKNDKANLAMEAKTSEKIIHLERKLLEEVGEVKKALSTIKDSLRDIEIDVKELQIEEFTRKGQQGAILNTIELLGIDIDANKEWRISKRLISVRDYLKEHPVRTVVHQKLIKQLNKIEGNKDYADLVKDIKDTIQVINDD